MPAVPRALPAAPAVPCCTAPAASAPPALAFPTWRDATEGRSRASAALGGAAWGWGWEGVEGQAGPYELCLPKPTIQKGRSHMLTADEMLGWVGRGGAWEAGSMQGHNIVLLPQWIHMQGCV